MKNTIASIVTFVLAAGCGDFADEPQVWIDYPDYSPTDAPQFAGFVDQEEHDVYCANNPEHAVCSELGTSKHAWTSREYYGQGHEAGVKACYSPTGTAGDCKFPKGKVFNVIYDPSACWAHTDVSLLRIQAMLDRAWLAIFSLNGVGGFTFQSGPNGAPPGNPQGATNTLTLGCMPASQAALGAFGPGSTTVKISNLPVGPHASDESAARLYSNSTLNINPTRIQSDLPTRFDCAVAENTRIDRFAYWVGLHEALHAVGFGHFTTGIMHPSAVPTSSSICSSPYPLPVPSVAFGSAMFNFNPNSSGVLITDGAALLPTGP